MPWGRLDDQFHRNEKQLSMSDAAFRVYVCAISYAYQEPQPTGFLPTHQARALAGSLGKPSEVINELVDLNAWEAVDGGWLIHDFEEYVERGSADRTRKWRERLRDASVTSRETSRETASEAGGDVPSRARTPATGISQVPNPYPVIPPVVPRDPEVTSDLNGAAAPPSQSSDPRVREVFDAWLGTLPEGTRRDLTPARAKVVRARLKDSTLEELIDAVRGWPNDPWEGRPQQNDLIQLLRNRQQVEKFRDLYREPPLLKTPAARASWQEQERQKTLARIREEAEAEGQL